MGERPAMDARRLTLARRTSVSPGDRRYAPPMLSGVEKGVFMNKLISVSLLALSWPGIAHAEADAASGDADGTIIVTASRAVEEAPQIGSAISVITVQDLQKNQITFVKDALIDQAGIIASSDRPGALTNVSLRGSNNGEILWLIDGIKLGDPSLISTGYQSDHLTSRDISRIEILRGNQSSLYGSDAIGGVINIITQRATEEGMKLNAEVEGGSHGTINGGASVIGKSGAIDYRITGTGYRQGGPSLADPRTASPAGSATEDDEYWRYGVSGRVGLQATNNLSLQAIGFWQDSFTDLDNSRSDSNDTVKKKEYAFAGQAAYISDDSRFKADLTGSRYVARRLYFGNFYSSDGDLFRGTRDNIALNLSAKDLGPLSLAVGGNYEWQRTNQVTLFSGGFKARIRIGSVYAEAALRPTEALTLTGAIRHDDNSRFGSFDTYRGTFAYVIGALKLRASYGTGAKAPGLYQLFDLNYGNPTLEAETSKGGDIGFDLAVSDSVNAQVSYFFNRKKNEIGFDNGRGLFGGYAQFGRTRAQGIEFALAVHPAPWLTVNQTVTYVEHKIDQSLSGNGAFVDSGRPKLAATTSVSLNPVESASITARVRTRDGDASSSFSPPTRAYVVADLLASYKVTDKIELYGRVVNLFDRWYQVSYGSQSLGRSVYGGVRVRY
jgi:vitamin B12 transporter